MILALLGPDDYTKLIKYGLCCDSLNTHTYVHTHAHTHAHAHTHTHTHRVDDDSGDRQNAKVVERLMPDKDYYIQIQTFKPEGGQFEFSITSW